MFRRTKTLAVLPLAALSLAVLALSLFSAGVASAQVDVPATAFAAGAYQDGDARVEVRLLSDTRTATDGDTVRVGLLFSMDPGWHIYWQNPGDSGQSTLVELESDELAFGPVQWPAPERFATAGGFIVTYGYAESVLLFAEAQVTDTGSGAAEVVATADFLACQDTCIPDRLTVARSIPLDTATEPSEADEVALFSTWASRVPVNPASVGLAVDLILSQSAVRPGDAFTGALAVVDCPGPPARGATCQGLELPESGVEAAFIPGHVDSVDLAASGSASHPSVYSGLVLGLSGQADLDDPGEDQTITGVVRLRRAGQADELALWVEEPLPRARPGAPVASVESPLLTAFGGSAGEGAEVDPTSLAPPETEPLEPTAGALSVPSVSLLAAFLLALLGGIILNLMPCVLPVLSIKVLALAELSNARSSQRAMHAAAYTGGIVASMMVLALAVIGLKAAGHAVGWGFQFQQPLFVAVVSAVVMIFALNLFGVFEFGVVGSSLDRLAGRTHGPSRSFFEGILAVLLATPCSAPLLGTAIGFAVVSPAPVILALLVTVGVGLALPFVVLAVIPGWTRLLPKPGPWLVRLRQLLAFPLLGTLVWLLSIHGQLTGPIGMTQLLAFLVAVAFATWLFGVLQRRQVALPAALAVALMVPTMAGGFTLDFPEVDGTAGMSAGWRAWSERAVTDELAAGRPVFVDFTAAWCATCKANEHLVIRSEAVDAAFARYNVSRFVADWTRPDDRIYAKLTEFGRAGVPMYLVYSPLAPDQPQLLPEILTVDSVLKALRQAADGSPAS